MLGRQNISVPPVAMMFAAVGLVALGIAGIHRGDELSLLSSSSSVSFASKQFLWLVIGVVSLGITLFVPYRQLREWSYLLYVCAMILLVVVYFLPARNGARRWIPIGTMFLQPSELAKLAFTLALARYLMFRKNQRTAWGLIPPFLMTVLPVLLIIREPDLGTSLLFFPVLFAILFAAGARLKHLVITLCAGLAMIPVLWNVMSAEQKSRVTAVFMQVDGGIPQTGDGYHLHQSKQLLALGGAWGSEINGMPLNDTAAYRLPAGRTDFVFCLIGERFGVSGTLSVLVLYVILICSGLCVARQTRDPYGRLIAIGLTTLLGTQVIINTSMTVGLAPITGLTLPLVSYGGSSLVLTCVALGLLINIGLRPGYDVAGQPFQFEG